MKKILIRFAKLVLYPLYGIAYIEGFLLALFISPMYWMLLRKSLISDYIKMISQTVFGRDIAKLFGKKELKK